jgi:hypothetical protein
MEEEAGRHRKAMAAATSSGSANDADEIEPCDFIRYLWSLLVTWVQSRLSASVLVASEIIIAST